MLVDKNSIVIDGIIMAPYLKQAEVQFNKGWGDDTGRNTLSGDFSGTFKGIYPKLILTFKRLSQSQLHTLSLSFDSPQQSVTYFDPHKNSLYTMETYSNDWGVVSKHVGRFEGVACSFIARRKRQ